MKATGVITFTIAFGSFCMLYAGYYDKLGVSYRAGMITSAVLTALFVVVFVVEQFVLKKQD
ncbi:MAG TPA: hypothetical protein PK926_11040 [Spirochaetota bacterium]|nr:hypothetical protein [Spirochaetota bacterium]HPI88415.1 hypothetical protein [Spirochaetota bacterium]HPR49884.1 hypothetical protein [Spirochaetota bacterium]